MLTVTVSIFCLILNYCCYWLLSLETGFDSTGELIGVAFGKGTLCSVASASKALDSMSPPAGLKVDALSRC